MIDQDHAKTLVPDRRLFIGNERVLARGGGVLPVLDPATGESLGEISAASPEDVDDAVAAARAAQPRWAARDARDRGQLLARLARLVKDEADDLAALESLDVGKPYSEARNGDLAQVVDALQYFAGAADKHEGRTIPVRGSQSVLNYTLREPVGVVGAIIPWNFPLLMAAWKLGPALAAGCTVVLKPAEQTPFTALRLADLILEAGFPAGVVNIVPGTGAVAGAALVSHPSVDKITFTGSTATGRHILGNAAKNLTPVSLELGGKSANIVFADAGNPDKLAETMARAIFYNQGECCTAGSRILVERPLFDDFVARIVVVANNLKVGPPFHRATQMGAQVSALQRERILAYVESGKREGARCVAGGGAASVADAPGGFFVSPTVFTEVESSMTIAQEEIFGPVVTLQAFDDEEHACRLADGTPYGLAAGVWTRDVGRAHRVARNLRAGTVWVNGYNRFDAASPFGGVKASGFGRENGLAAMELYTQEKSIWIDTRS